MTPISDDLMARLKAAGFHKVARHFAIEGLVWVNPKHLTAEQAEEKLKELDDCRVRVLRVSK